MSETNEMQRTTKQFYISSNEEWFSEGPFDSREDAIVEGRNQYPGEHFYVAERVYYQPFSRDYVEEIRELEQDDVYDECGSGAADNWPPTISGSKRDAIISANEKIRAIMLDLFGNPTVFTVENCERIEAEVNA